MIYVLVPVLIHPSFGWIRASSPFSVHLTFSHFPFSRHLLSTSILIRVSLYCVCSPCSTGCSARHGVRSGRGGSTVVRRIVVISFFFSPPPPSHHHSLLIITFFFPSISFSFPSFLCTLRSFPYPPSLFVSPLFLLPLLVFPGWVRDVFCL